MSLKRNMRLLRGLKVRGAAAAIVRSGAVNGVSERARRLSNAPGFGGSDRA